MRFAQGFGDRAGPPRRWFRPMVISKLTQLSFVQTLMAESINLGVRLEQLCTSEHSTSHSSLDCALHVSGPSAWAFLHPTSGSRCSCGTYLQDHILSQRRLWHHDPADGWFGGSQTQKEHVQAHQLCLCRLGHLDNGHFQIRGCCAGEAAGKPQVVRQVDSGELPH